MARSSFGAVPRLRAPSRCKVGIDNTFWIVCNPHAALSGLFAIRMRIRS